MTRTLTVEGDVNSVDTVTSLTTQGSVSNPTRQVPSNVTRISKVMASSAVNFSAAGCCVAVLRLSGPAVKNGEQTIVIGGHGGQNPQSGSDAPSSPSQLFILDNADIEVSPNDQIRIDCELMGDDLGDGQVQCTLVYA